MCFNMKTKSKGVRRTSSEQALAEAVVDGGLVATSLDPIGFALASCPNDGTLVDAFIDADTCLDSSNGCGVGVVDVPAAMSNNLMIHRPEVRTVMDVDGSLDYSNAPCHRDITGDRWIIVTIRLTLREGHLLTGFLSQRMLPGWERGK